MTVCPPKGSITALNYDLMKADNNSLTVKGRDDLKNAVYSTITKPSHDQFMRNMLATINTINLKQVYEGFQSTPMPNLEAGLEMTMWNNNGTLQTPDFGEEYDEDYYKEDKKYSVTIEFPKGMAQQMSSSLLVIKLEVDTGEEEGWQEEVSITGVPRSNS